MTEPIEPGERIDAPATRAAGAAAVPSRPSTPALTIEALHLGFDGPAGWRTVVDGLSMTLEAGEIVGLLGPSGCGKTTVLRAIAGFEPLRGGRIRLEGETVSTPETSVPPERRRLGMMFQEFALFPHLDVTHNVGFGLRTLGRKARDRRVDALLALVGLTGLGGRHPHELSGGQQQRVALARALAPTPRLMLLDEPFSNLDGETRARLVGDVRSILKAAGQAALLVTHDAAEARTFADRVQVMRDGRLLDTRPDLGTAAEAGAAAPVAARRHGADA
jgi:iron(III) transport system ATP-binding protein